MFQTVGEMDGIAEIKYDNTAHTMKRMGTTVSMFEMMMAMNVAQLTPLFNKMQ